MSTTEVSPTALKPPQSSVNVVTWLRQNLFNGWINSLITVVLGWLVITVLYQVVNWVFTDATWAPIVTNLRLFWVGRYPETVLWRVQACLALVLLLFGLSGGLWGGVVRAVASGLAALMVLLALLPFGGGMRLYLAGTALLLGAGFVGGLRFPRLLRWPTIMLWLLSPLIVILLIRGFVTWSVIPFVDTGLWGGLLLTIFLAVVGIVASFPLGVLLALGRRSKLPVVKGFCVAYIELIRGVPLITVLFMAMLMLPLFLPPHVRVDNLVRVLVAITLFSAAYLAENVRGGLQSVPNGQVEAARALGLNVFQSTVLIVLPQALRAVIPAIVGQFISLFKDTSLVSLVGLTELFGIARGVIEQPEWITVTGGVQREVLIFVGLIYWIFCFSMAQISRRIETRLGVGTR
ncbi:MAG: amino acid ABC transporter permease [Chloroflexota bacterium]|nr:amino acid ABC transporter permease [Chloroflexota bacterium]PLS80514.1 MAG: amino acid ABC transporter permease [Chloroflexota bacterium]